ncbi:MAG: BsuPI-related putative proteinase inhibitor [Dehalococcoidia bacterium]
MTVLSITEAGRTAIIVVVLGLALAAVSCGGDDDGAPGASPTVTNDSQASPVETPAGSPGGPEECTVSEEQIGLVSKVDFEQEGEFSQGGQFTAGAEVKAQMRLINCTEEDTTLFYTSTKRYEMVVEPEDGSSEVFRSSEGKTFAQTEGTEVIAPQGTVVYEEIWDQTGKDGDQVPPGIYKVSFLSVGCGVEDVDDCPPFGVIARIEILE